MRYKFYDSPEYRILQAEKTRVAWMVGQHASHIARMVVRKCKRDSCDKYFETKPYDPKIFCSQNCAAAHNNHTRPISLESRLKISRALMGKPSKHKGRILTPRLVKNCLKCSKTFETPRWQDHKYCSAPCSIRDIGSRTTSPKAAKGKNGIRPDISPTLNFYSRWEANFARILNLQNIPWAFQPKTFRLTSQNYAPDFYLPRSETYIEIKNFLSDFSRQRDEEFRNLYPEEKLVLILKPEYLKLQEYFSPLIENWEFS